MPWLYRLPTAFGILSTTIEMLFDTSFSGEARIAHSLVLPPHDAGEEAEASFSKAEVQGHCCPKVFICMYLVVRQSSFERSSFLRQALRRIVPFPPMHRDDLSEESSECFRGPDYLHKA